MTDATTTVDTYLAAWNETDTAKRARLIERAWVGDGRYSDPMLEAAGHTALAEMVAGVQTKSASKPPAQASTQTSEIR